jgi:hypothetical protein
MVLPEGVDPASIRAEFKDGMLEVHIPRALEAAKPKTTKIAIGGAAEANVIEDTVAGTGPRTSRTEQGDALA